MKLRRVELPESLITLCETTCIKTSDGNEMSFNEKVVYFMTKGSKCLEVDDETLKLIQNILSTAKEYENSEIKEKIKVSLKEIFKELIDRI